MKRLIGNFLLLAIFHCSNVTFAQVRFGLNTRFTTTKNFGLDFKLGYKSVLMNIGFTTPLKKDFVGTRMNNIGWNQFPEDHYKQGAYYEFTDLGLHYLIHKNIIIGAKVGLGKETVFRNCYDRFEILGNDGYYYMMRSSGNRKNNIGFDVDYVWNAPNSGISVLAGLSWSTIYKTGISIGYFVSF